MLSAYTEKYELINLDCDARMSLGAFYLDARVIFIGALD
jgi:hypothetical protein